LAKLTKDSGLDGVVGVGTRSQDGLKHNWVRFLSLVTLRVSGQRQYKVIQIRSYDAQTSINKQGSDYLVIGRQ